MGPLYKYIGTDLVNEVACRHAVTICSAISTSVDNGGSGGDDVKKDYLRRIPGSLVLRKEDLFVVIVVRHPSCFSIVRPGRLAKKSESVIESYDRAAQRRNESKVHAGRPA